MNRLSKSALENVAKHKYSGIDDSILAKLILQKYWNFCLRFVPLSIAPNLITLTGTITILISFFIVGYYSPKLDGELPTWVYILSGLSLFFYQTMDNLDGKQARRTGSSSPLGQLFDHGCDSIVCTLQSLIVASVLNYELGIMPLVQTFTIALLPFWMATWEEYHTGTLHLGPINGPDEGIVIIVITLLATGFLGSSFWVIRPLESFNFLPQIISGLRLNEIVISSLAFPTIITCYFNIKHVVHHLQSKNKPVLPALSQILVWIIITGCSFIWYYTSTLLLNENSIWFTNIRTILFSIGFIFGELVSRLILAHMCHEKYNIIQAPLIPLLLATFVSVLNYYRGEVIFSEYILMIIFATFSLVHYSLFVKDTIQQLCSYLKIKCFKITQKKQN
ncbi:hypothetical protein DICPUDRAFT_49392 [Dictyostelium purpureum]|uniref:CDP-alcohol phosphatidyltransferase n=1 Tax=Dictyostelium purpureum TaxID=5786 RepID=F0ZTK2_DICPU|nr:uncharacterized protein DICPUDRAFT_49392 [Dictyostelium purpureum]EGC32712.1 hypothetical protein DICPUDRAFT_49392 [Dictyostelium purpureum]|eukprot:XP_003290745.1 hypothetical protein DICPUDRAFT_49392 [Dictyostelium purpureum]